MALDTILQNATAIFLVVIFIVTLMLPKLWKYLVNGFILLSLGVLPVLFNLGKITFNPWDFPLFEYFIIVMVILCGRELIVEGVKEENIILKWTSSILGIILIVITTIPTLYNMGGISFNLPEFPEIIIYSIYIISGLLLAAGSFAFATESSKI